MKVLLRFAVFVVALGALGVILGGSWWYFVTHSRGTTEISMGDVPGGRKPQSFEDLVISSYLTANADKIDEPASSDPTEVSFVIESGESANSITDRLIEMGLIKNGQLFRRFLQYNGLDATMQAGNYSLRRDMSMREVAMALQRAEVEEVDVTIPEGWRAEQVAEMLAENEIVDSSLFLTAVRQGAIDHPVLAGKPAGTSLEGYLFPDTYRIKKGATPEEIITQMLDNMQSKLPPNWKEAASARGSFYDVLTVASIVEREAQLASERPLIASVYLNRLDTTRCSESGGYLQADPTVQYAMGYQADTGQWWKTPVTLEEYQGVSSPYNTYLNPGLPPGPICSPGISAIQATLEPAETLYCFFVATEGGAHVFSVTLAEHEQNIGGQ